jgi:hypothetical protein
LSRLRAASVVAIFCTLVAPTAAFAVTGKTAAAGTVSPPVGFRPFAPNSIWNLPLHANAQIAPDNMTMIKWLDTSITNDGTWINTTSCGDPEYWASSSTPTVTVALHHPSYEDPALIQAWSAVPIPGNAAPATCGDRNFSVEQVQPKGSVKEWEFWDAAKAANGTWTAAWGGAINNILTDDGFAPAVDRRSGRAIGPTIELLLERDGVRGVNGRRCHHLR